MSRKRQKMRTRTHLLSNGWYNPGKALIRDERDMAHMQVSQDRWASIKQFVAHWHRPLAQEDGLPLTEIREAESWFDLPFPLALQEWYLLAGRRSDLNAATNSLLSPADLEVSDVIPEFHMRTAHPGAQ